MQMIDNKPKIHDIVAWIESHCKIQNPKKGPPIPYRRTPIHRQFFDECRAFRLEESIDVCVKPRQVGISTANLCYVLALCVLMPGASVLWVSQDEGNAKAIRRKFKVIWNSVISSAGSGLRKEDITLDNPNEFVLSNGSHISFLWSGNNSETSINVGRGDTFHFIVFTEIAYWAAPEKTWEAIFPAIQHAGASIVFDSTPNGTSGRGSLFYRAALKAKSRSRGYRLHFWPWFLDYRYRKPRSHGNFDAIPLNAEELELVNSFGLDLEQISFRRYQIDQYRGDVDVFKEIYPETFEEAFRTPGTSIFDRAVLRRTMRRLAGGVSMLAKDSILSAIPVGEIALRVFGAFSLSDNPTGYVRIFNQPESGKRYSIGIDSSQGIFDGEKDETDWFGITVIDDETASVCAYCKAKVHPIIAASVASALGALYHEAKVFIEDSSSGPLIYRYMTECLGRGEITKHMASPILGAQYRGGAWLIKVNTATRPLIIGQLLQAINDESTLIPDDEFLAEASSLERNPKTHKIEAADGQHDDLMLSLGLALWGRYLHLTRGLSAHGLISSTSPPEEGTTTQSRYAYAQFHSSARGLPSSDSPRRLPGLSGQSDGQLRGIGLGPARGQGGGGSGLWGIG